MNKPKAWIVTTVFNRFKTLQRYFDCLAAQDYDNFSLVLVDHGDENVTDNLSLPNNTILLKSSPEKWWTAAVNVALDYLLNNIKVPDSDLIILQNDDSTFGPTFIGSLVKIAVQEKAVIGSVAIDRRTKRILHANLQFVPVAAKYKYCHYGEDLSALNEGNLLKSDVLKGRGVVYPVEIVRRIGFLEERLPQYKSDHEWSNRAKRYGFEVYVTSQAITETVIDTQERMNKKHPLKQFWKLLFGIRSTSNLQDSFYYFTICYGKTLGFYLFFVSSIRTIVVSFLQMIKSFIIRSNTLKG
ncbi:glycosyltransferase family 2 protein [Thermodesulfobacteriota bacterium]